MLLRTATAPSALTGELTRSLRVSMILSSSDFCRRSASTPHMAAAVSIECTTLAPRFMAQRSWSTASNITFERCRMPATICSSGSYSTSAISTSWKLCSSSLYSCTSSRPSTFVMPFLLV